MSANDDDDDYYDYDYYYYYDYDYYDYSPPPRTGKNKLAALQRGRVGPRIARC